MKNLENFNITGVIQQFLVENNFLKKEAKLKEDPKIFNNEKTNEGRFLELILFLEERFRIFFSETELLPEKFDTLEKISILVEKKMKNIV